MLTKLRTIKDRANQVEIEVGAQARAQTKLPVWAQQLIRQQVGTQTDQAKFYVYRHLQGHMRNSLDAY